jgi:hypothetical protein
VGSFARRGLCLLGVAALCGSVWTACDLNPQPLPPGDQADAAQTVGQGGGDSGRGGTSSSGGGSGASSSGSSSGGASSNGSSSGGPQPPPGDAGSGDATTQPTAEGGSEDGASPDGGGPDAGEGGASDAGADSPGDAAGACIPDPSSDSQCAHVGGLPHLVRCVGPGVPPPAGCQLLSVGDVTDLYCCP